MIPVVQPIRATVTRIFALRVSLISLEFLKPAGLETIALQNLLRGQPPYGRAADDKLAFIELQVDACAGRRRRFWRELMTRENQGTPDLEGLAVFVRSTDRQLSPFFVGREAETRDIETTLLDTMNSWRSGAAEPAAGRTRLVQGAPGAGKSALLAYLRAQWAAADETAPLGVVIRGPDLQDHKSLARRIAAFVNPDLSAAFRQSRNSGSTGSTGVGIGGLRPGKQRQRSMTEALESGDLTMRSLDWTRPLALIVDEAQDLTADAFRLMQPYRLGEHGCPIVPVFAGSGNSRTVLAGNGFARLSDGSVHNLGCLGCLDAVEAAEAVSLMLSQFRVITTGANDDWPERPAPLLTPRQGPAA